MTKEETYKKSLQEIRALVQGEENEIANYANTAAVLKENHAFFWVGFYLVQNNELILGPFQGPVACTRIAHGKGVCGTSWAENRLINVPDVHAFPGHIACSELSKSEIVLPVTNGDGEVIAVLDIDSDREMDFDRLDEEYLQSIVNTLSNVHV